MVVISLCDRTGIMVEPWAEAGFDCYCVDLRHPVRVPRRKGRIIYQWGDVRTWSPPAIVRHRLYIIFAFPPCTHVAASGARDFRTKGTALLCDSLEMFSACERAAKWASVPYMIENPVGKFSDHMQKPDFTFQPWQFGDNYQKLTCLWTGNGFNMPEPTVVEKPDDVQQSILDMPDSKGRADRRSTTPPGFARAVFEANKPERHKAYGLDRRLKADAC